MGRAIAMKLPLFVPRGLLDCSEKRIDNNSLLIYFEVESEFNVRYSRSGLQWPQSPEWHGVGLVGEGRYTRRALRPSL